MAVYTPAGIIGRVLARKSIIFYILMDINAYAQFEAPWQYRAWRDLHRFDLLDIQIQNVLKYALFFCI